MQKARLRVKLSEEERQILNELTYSVPLSRLAKEIGVARGTLLRALVFHDANLNRFVYARIKKYIEQRKEKNEKP